MLGKKLKLMKQLKNLQWLWKGNNIIFYTKIASEIMIRVLFKLVEPFLYCGYPTHACVFMFQQDQGCTIPPSQRLTFISSIIFSSSHTILPNIWAFLNYCISHHLLPFFPHITSPRNWLWNKFFFILIGLPLIYE